MSNFIFRKHVLLLLFFQLFIFISLPSHAFFCPNNFSQINVGDSLPKVKQLCGKPDKEEEIPDEVKNTPQEWNYYLPQTVAAGFNTTTQGTLKAQFTFNAEGSIINMSVNGIGVGATTLCNNQTIQLGDDKNKVEAACGKPTIINQQASSQNPQDLPKLTILTYGQTQFTFRAGVLVKGK